MDIIKGVDFHTIFQKPVVERFYIGILERFDFTSSNDFSNEMLSCGRVTAVQIGTNASARIQLGKRVLWNVRRVNAYLDSISE